MVRASFHGGGFTFADRAVHTPTSIVATSYVKFLFNFFELETE